MTAGLTVVEILARGAGFTGAVTDLGVDTLRASVLDGEALEGSLMTGLSFWGVSFDTPVGLTKNGEEERRDEVDFVGESGPMVFFCAGDDLAGVGVFLGVGGDFGTGLGCDVCFGVEMAFATGAGITFFGVGANFGEAESSVCFGVDDWRGDNCVSGFFGCDTVLFVGTIPVFAVGFKSSLCSEPLTLISVNVWSTSSFVSATSAAVGSDFFGSLTTGFFGSLTTGSFSSLTTGKFSIFFKDFAFDKFSCAVSSGVATLAGRAIIKGSTFGVVELSVCPTGIKFDRTRGFGVAPFPAGILEPSYLSPGGVGVVALFCCSKKARNEETCA